MKICYLNKGISVHDQKILSELVNQGNDVHLISFSKNINVSVPELVIHRTYIPVPVLTFPLIALITFFLMRRIKPDIVIGNYMLTYGFFAALARFHPLLQIAWGSDVLIAPQNPMFRIIVKYSLRQADLVIVDCETGKQTIIELGYPAEKIVVLPYGIDLAVFNPDISPSHIRKETGWEDNTIVICTRQHNPVYGMKYLIEAISIVVEQEPDVRFLLIGYGSETEALKNQADTLGIKDYVRFTGMVANSELPGYLAASDIYVSSSLSDGTSVCLLEAMACGLPVVVTDIPAILEWVQNDVNGLVVPRCNPLALADAILDLVRDESERIMFGKKNYDIAKQRASWEDNAMILKGACNSLLNESR